MNIRFKHKYFFQRVIRELMAILKHNGQYCSPELMRVFVLQAFAVDILLHLLKFKFTKFIKGFFLALI